MNHTKLIARVTIIGLLVVAALNLAALFGLHLTVEQLGGINVFIATVTGAVRSWVDPTGAIGPKMTPDEPSP